MQPETPQHPQLPQQIQPEQPQPVMSPAPDPTPQYQQHVPIMQPVVQENVARGVLFALAAPIAGVIGWVILWRMGFIASLVSFGIAFLTVWLYQKGAGVITRKSLFPIIGIVLLGVVLAFLSGMVSDAYDAYTADSSGDLSTLFSSRFWSFFNYNLTNNSELWGSYTGDIFMAFIFAILGTFGVVKTLFKTTAQGAAHGGPTV